MRKSTIGFMLLALICSCATPKFRTAAADGMLDLRARTFDDITAPQFSAPGLPGIPSFVRTAPPVSVVVTVHNGRDVAMSVQLACGTDDLITMVPERIPPATDRLYYFAVPRRLGRVTFSCEIVDFSETE